MQDTAPRKDPKDPVVSDDGLDTWRTLLDRTRPGRAVSSAPMTDRLLALATRNRVLPSLARTLSPDDGSDAAMRLRKAVQRDAFVALRLSAWVLKVARILDEARTPGVFFKGTPLAVTLYGTISDRHPGDIDVIVEGRHARRAVTALVEAGFEPLDHARAVMEDDLTAFMLARHNHAELVRSGDGIVVELHWHSSARPWLNTDLTTRAGPVSLSGGDTVRVPDPVDHALHLCVHGALHLWARMKWFQDVRVLFHDGDWIGGDWAALAQRAREARLEPTLGSTALLVSQVDGRPPPEPLRAMCARPDIERLARTLRRRMDRIAGDEIVGGPLSITGLADMLASEHVWGRLSDRPGRWRRSLALNTLSRASLTDVRAVPALKRMPWLTPFVRPVLEIARRPRNAR